MKAQPRVAILLGVLLPGSGHAAAAEFPVPPDVQWEAIKYPAGYGCGLFAENQAQKGKGWFISGSAPATEAECRKSCEAQITKAQTDYRGQSVSVTGTCFIGKKPLYSAALAEGTR
ncbi:MAG TPA: hypothetical protein VEW70_07580 [Burkholderiales bacterium]|nr:hypothetical protein [Burkholderiales bacterium]